MAICRCLESHSPPVGKKEPYVCYAYPVGYPKDTAAICGRNDPKPCNYLAVLWLTEAERQDYLQGTRIFDIKSNLVKIKADDSGCRTI